jgi:hypothetical protein
MVTFFSAHNVREPGTVVAHDFDDDMYADTATALEAEFEILTFVPIATLKVALEWLLRPPATIEYWPLAACSEGSGQSTPLPRLKRLCDHGEWRATYVFVSTRHHRGPCARFLRERRVGSVNAPASSGATLSSR